MVKIGFKNFIERKKPTLFQEGFDKLDVKKFIESEVEGTYVPTSVYRFQFNQHFTFQDGAKWISYLSELGIDALYCSPYLQTRPGSPHGYDVTCPYYLNPELGSNGDYNHLCNELKEHEMGHIFDLVANHMAASELNPWWRDMLENGRFSIYGHFFDVNWTPSRKDLKNKVFIPILITPYQEALTNREIELIYRNGELLITVNHHTLPINPTSYVEVLKGVDVLESTLGKDHEYYITLLAVLDLLETLPKKLDKKEKRKRKLLVEKGKKTLSLITQNSEPIKAFIEKKVKEVSADPTKLDELLKNQHYRLSYWQAAPQNINYRRFFDIHELAALRVEDETVFLEYHRFLYQLILEGQVQGLRVDHPDGFYEPAIYFQRLQHLYLYNKIKQEYPFSQDELHYTGEVIWDHIYERVSPLYVVVEKILHEHEQLPADWNLHGTVGYEYLNRLNGVFIEQSAQEKFDEIYSSFANFTEDASKLLYESKHSFGMLYMTSEIKALCQRLYESLDKPLFTYEELVGATSHLIAAFPVYRSYITSRDTKIAPWDIKVIEQAFAKVRQEQPSLSAAALTLLEEAYFHIDRGEKNGAYLDFILKFQQLTPPITAKGLEDTHFYVYNRLVSLNEVGGNPSSFGTSVETFHEHNQLQNEKWPYTWLTSSTHDTKRSEDVRQRINVLSEIPDIWKEHIELWRAQHLKEPPDPNMEYFIYQTLIGMWPTEPVLEEEFLTIQDRLSEYLIKAARESKVHTNWINHHTDYENALVAFLKRLIRNDKSNPFWKTFLPLNEKIAGAGKLNSLSALTLRLGSPGVFDLYQGTELWDDSLVDPDNRRPIDFEKRKELLNGEHSKLFVLKQGLNLRKKYPHLFVGGEYIPLEVEGKHKEHVIAFMRKDHAQVAVVIATRFHFTQGSWEETYLTLPNEMELKNIFTNKTHLIQKEDKLEINQILSSQPSAILEGKL